MTLFTYLPKWQDRSVYFLVRPMKRLRLIALLSLVVSGCTTQQTSLKSFYAFHKQVAAELSDSCDCGPIHQDLINGWIFDIQPRQQREFSIRVWKCEFLTQEEWDRNYNSATNRVSDDITKPPTQTREQVAREAAGERWNLPDGSYDTIGISMELQWPEMVPGEWEKQNEVNKDREKVVRYMDQIKQLLKLYHRPNDALELIKASPGLIVHPSFGIAWDEVPPPTLTNSAAMAAVRAFVASNGWNMHTGWLSFGYLPRDQEPHPRPIRGLPWEAIKDREFEAFTEGGILYVILGGGHHSLNGIAYNPNTNSFPPEITGHKPLAGHWYVWGHPEDPISFPRIYEDGRFGEPSGPANRSQPIGSETNSTPAAAGSRR